MLQRHDPLTTIAADTGRDAAFYRPSRVQNIPARQPRQRLADFLQAVHAAQCDGDEVARFDAVLG